jgi:hypothetical protein
MLRRIFGPKREEVSGSWRKLHNDELHKFYTLLNMVGRSRRMSWGRHTTRTGEIILKCTTSIGIALGYGLNDRRFESREGLGIFLFTTASRPALSPTQPPIQWVAGALSLGVKRPVGEADHPPKLMRGAIPPLPQYAFMAWCSVKAQHNFICTFFFYPAWKIEEYKHLNLADMQLFLTIDSNGPCWIWTRITNMMDVRYKIGTIKIQRV